MKMKLGLLVFFIVSICPNLLAGEFEFDWNKLPAQSPSLKVIIIKTDDNMLAEKAEYQNGKIAKSYVTFDNGKMWILVKGYEYKDNLLIRENEFLGGKVKAFRVHSYDAKKRLSGTKEYSSRNGKEELTAVISYEYDTKGNIIRSIKKDPKGKTIAEETFSYNSKGFVENYHYFDYVEEYDYGMSYQYTYDAAGRMIKETITAAHNPKEIWNVFLLEYQS